MGKFLPLQLRFVNGTVMTVTSISEARAALARQWRNPTSSQFRRAQTLIDAAIAGTCRPDVAFDAFRQAADRQGLLQPAKPSAGLRQLDQLTSK